jgi:hypothetical protein
MMGERISLLPTFPTMSVSEIRMEISKSPQGQALLGLISQEEADRLQPPVQIIDYISPIR